MMGRLDADSPTFNATLKGTSMVISAGGFPFGLLQGGGECRGCANIEK